MPRAACASALDVFDNEPTAATADFSTPLVALPGVYGTHHIGASTDQAQEAIAAETVRIVRAFKETGKVPNVVNLARRTPATHMLIVRHRDRPGVLAHVFHVLRSRSINVQETENIVFEGAEAGVARINLDGAPDGDLLDAHADRQRRYPRLAGRTAANGELIIMPTATQRIHNFSAGPAVLPLPVLEEAQRDLVSLPGVGMSVMEISHRSKPFDEIIEAAEARHARCSAACPTTTTCCSCRAAPACSSRWCR